MTGYDGDKWCFTALRPKLWIFDAWVVFPLGLWLLHWSYWTLALAVASIAISLFLGRLGIPVNVALIYLRCVLAGKIRPVNDPFQYRRRCRW